MDKPGRNISTGKVVQDYDILAKDWNTPEEDKAWEYLSDKTEVKVDSESVVPYNKSKVSVKIRSRFDARLEYTGQATGKRYVWNKAGSEVDVDVEDSEILLAKHIGDRLCCGNSPDVNRIFERVF